ncbi:GFA family protein [Pseudomarimonas salicorniae]|uniref:GFA family protein n=1 Tax=Pseudomarimonas salicorniae TaxID=2933270 RepID=A0ABT0GEY9_9GAMM|nr:GFA family protein [Lysobacter sp. CAU 1642]MCK7593110.1 GFA family protein [Lysobacter sp. CAU 1642]
MSEASGRCQCGAVGVRLTLPSKWVAHCHCTMCRRAHGAAFVTWLGMDSDRARIEDGKGQLRWYASSAGAERGFCGRCGSPMFFRSQRWPAELHIARAVIDGKVDRAPQAHVFWNTHVDWARPDPADGLPRKAEV